MQQMTNGYVADELMKGNWQILNAVLEDNLERTTREQAIRDIHFGWVYFAGYYIGSGYDQIINSVHQWDAYVGFKP